MTKTLSQSVTLGSKIIIWSLESIRLDNLPAYLTNHIIIRNVDFLIKLSNKKNGSEHYIPNLHCKPP